MKSHRQDVLTTVTVHRRGLTLVHIGAFVGTVLAAFAIDAIPYSGRSVTSGAVTLTFFRAVWFGWPILVSLAASRSFLPGKSPAIWIFVVLLVVVTLVGGFFLDSALAINESRWGVFKVNAVEAVLLSFAAQALGEMKFGR